jgi:hypothetical protein
MRKIVCSFRGLDQIKKIENDVALGLLETLPVQIIVIHRKRRDDAAGDRSTVRSVPIK